MIDLDGRQWVFLQRNKEIKMFSQIQPPAQPFSPVQPEPQEWYYIIMGTGFETA
jgi:hypothetical protein